jgi:hypothetical protein
MSGGLPEFRLAGVKLYGKFEVKFSSGKWTFDRFDFIETEVSAEDMSKFKSAAESGAPVPIEFGNGNGKAIITSFARDPETKLLKSIEVTLTEWHFA